MSGELVYAMPSMGADMEHGTVLAWLVAPGDEVHRGDVVARIDTEKAEVDAEIWVDGIVVELLAQTGDCLPVGAPLARLGTAGAEQGASPVPAATAPPREGAPHEAPTFSPLVRHDADRLGVDLRQVHGSGVGGAVTRRDLTPPPPVHAAAGGTLRPGPGAGAFARSSPYARRLARDAGVAVAEIAGSGPAGAVLARDVAPRPAPARSDAPPEGATPDVAEGLGAPVTGHDPGTGDAGESPLAAAVSGTDRSARIRWATAEIMARANRDIPHYYLTLELDVTPLLTHLAARNAELAPAARLLPAAALLAATARAAAQTPDLNGHWLADGFHPVDGVDLGVAVSLRGGGLVAPVIVAAHRAPLEELMARLRALVQRARTNTLRSSDLGAPSITVTNLGGVAPASGRGGGAAIDAVLPIIYPPQVAMVGFGQIRERPWAIDGMLSVRSVLTVSLAADHRASDGHLGARFLGTLAAKLDDLVNE